MDRLDKKLLPLAIVAFLGISACIFAYRVNFKLSQKLMVVNEGVQTCFSRVGQSFTAQMISDLSSIYLSPDFLKLTGECFSEVLSQVASTSLEGEAIAKGLNSLSSDVHWFHEKLKSGTIEEGIAPQIDLRSNLISRYQKLENQTISIDQKINDGKLQAQKKLYQYSFGLWFSFTFFVLIFIRIFYLNFKSAGIISMFEKKIKPYFGSDLKKEKEVVIQLFDELFTSFKMKHSRELFSQLFNLNEVVPTIPHTIPEESFNNFNENSSMIQSMVEETMNQTSNESVQKLLELSAINLDKTISKVIDIFSDKLFSYGIRLYIDIEDNICIWADEEPLIQLLFNLINNATEAVSPMIEKKEIHLQVKKLGGAVFVEIRDTGVGVDTEIVEAFNMDDNEKIMRLGAVYQVCHEFIKEFEGQMSIGNWYDKNEKIAGSKVRLIFKGARFERTPSRLKNVIKGKKKELLQDMMN